MNTRHFRLLVLGDIVKLSPEYIESSNILFKANGEFFFQNCSISNPETLGHILSSENVWQVDEASYYLRISLVNSRIGDIKIKVGLNDILPTTGYCKAVGFGDILNAGDIVCSSANYRFDRHFFPSMVGLTKVNSRVKITNEDELVDTRKGAYIARDLHKLSHNSLDIIGASNINLVVDVRYCDNCRAIHHRSGDNLCERCYSDSMFHCEDCGDEVVAGYSIYDHVEGHGRVCESCLHSYTECNNCGEYHDEEGSYCSSCRGRELIKPWNWEPDDRAFFKVKGENPQYFFGVELEVGCDEPVRLAEDITELAPDDLVYFMEDSSIPEDGIEMVTNPFSWEYYLKSGKNTFSTILDKMDGVLGAYPDESCGIHIHVSRSAFSGQQHLYSFLRLLTGSVNRRFTTAIAERNTSEWASLSNQGDVSDIVSKAKRVKYGTFQGRYTAVNMGNDHTIEIRIFKSTLDNVEFFKNIEYVRATIEYTRHMPIKRAVNALSFVSHVLNSTEYPNLKGWLLDKSNLIPRGSRAMYKVCDKIEDSRNKKANKLSPRGIRFKARKLMADYEQISRPSALYRSIGIEQSEAGVMAVVEELHDSLQSRVKFNI